MRWCPMRSQPCNRRHPAQCGAHAVGAWLCLLATSICRSSCFKGCHASAGVSHNNNKQVDTQCVGVCLLVTSDFPPCDVSLSGLQWKPLDGQQMCVCILASVSVQTWPAGQSVFCFAFLSTCLSCFSCNALWLDKSDSWKEDEMHCIQWSSVTSGVSSGMGKFQLKLKVHFGTGFNINMWAGHQDGCKQWSLKSVNRNTALLRNYTQSIFFWSICHLLSSWKWHGHLDKPDC